MPSVGFGSEVISNDISFHLATKKIVGTLTLPKNIAHPPVAIILHGMSGNRHGNLISETNIGIYERLANRLSENGFATLRISTGGRGGSEGDFVDMTFERRINEAIAAVKWLNQQYRFDMSNISLIGHSQGSLIAVAGAARLETLHPIKSLILIAPQTDALRTYQRAMGMDVYRKGIAASGNEVISWQRIGGSLRSFRSGFFKGLSEIDIVKDLKEYNGSILVITGKRDRLAPARNAMFYLENFAGRITHKELDVGHNMGASLGLNTFDETSDVITHWLSKEKRGPN